MTQPDTSLIGVCSRKPRPSLQSNRGDPAATSKTGHCFWGKDVWHIRKTDERTVCGRNSSDYLNIGEMKPDWHLCEVCARRAGLPNEF